MSITFICGKLCSGKTTLSEVLVQQPNTIVIEVSSIVKQILNSPSAKRAELQGNDWMDKAIIHELELTLNRQIDRNLNCPEPNPRMVIVGVRQLSILENFANFNPTYVWLELSSKERKRRYQLDKKNLGQSFEQAEQRDIDLGILEIKKYIFEQK